MKDARKTRRAVPSAISPPSDSFDELCEDRIVKTDTDALVKEITDPLIEAMKRDIEKIDVTAFKK